MRWKYYPFLAKSVMRISVRLMQVWPWQEAEAKLKLKRKACNGMTAEELESLYAGAKYQ